MVGLAVVVVATELVTTGVVVSELPPHPETTNKNVSATARFLIGAVCHPPLRGTGATSEPLGHETIDKLPAVSDPPNGGLAASDRGRCVAPRDKSPKANP